MPHLSPLTIANRQALKSEPKHNTEFAFSFFRGGGHATHGLIVLQPRCAAAARACCCIRHQQCRTAGGTLVNSRSRSIVFVVDATDFTPSVPQMLQVQRCLLKATDAALFRCHCYQQSVVCGHSGDFKNFFVRLSHSIPPQTYGGKRLTFSSFTSLLFERRAMHINHEFALMRRVKQLTH